ncbi:MAG TPA: beta-propeller fold lactonase family protein [Steroidobacteraceae bacterium]|jgi:6-phosphogluconolactonase (cycloisomerase 2 family)
MKSHHSYSIRASVAAICLLAAGATRAQDASSLAATDVFSRPEAAHAVFVMTNDANSNEVLAFERNGNGSLRQPHSYSTEGRGSGGTVDPLASQGSLTLSQDHSWLFAANAGSGSVSVFHVNGARLDLTDKVPTQGSEPNAVAEHGNLVYVLNTAGSSSVVGFRLIAGHLRPIEHSLRFLSTNGAGSASLSFSPDGRYLLVTERTTNSIDVFSVLPDGRLSTLTNNAGRPGTFSVGFAPNGTAIVSETGPGGANSSTVSSYAVQGNRSLKAISHLPTGGDANCWNAITPNGRFVYVSNAGTSSIAGFALGNGGTLTALPGTVVGHNPDGAANLDIVISSDGAFLYTLNAGAGSVGVFAIDAKSGSLKKLGTVDDLPAGAGLNGIAAN